jgi:hypothetical protein
VWGLDRRWRAFGSLERSTLVYSPEILAHDIVHDRAGLGVAGTLGERWSVQATATAGALSDGNRFRGLTSAVEYRVPTWATRLTVGYRLRLEGYAEAMGHGYFDPSRFVSHLGVVDLRDTFWRRRAYYALHLEVGIHSFDSAGVRFGNDRVLQWDGALGLPAGENLYLEGYGSWSNYIAESPTGFRSRRLGARLVVRLAR